MAILAVDCVFGQERVGGEEGALSGPEGGRGLVKGAQQGSSGGGRSGAGVQATEEAGGYLSLRDAHGCKGDALEAIEGNGGVTMAEAGVPSNNPKKGVRRGYVVR